MESAIIDRPVTTQQQQPPLPKAATRAIIDGNEAAASVAHRLSEVIAIYPITPSSNI